MPTPSSADTAACIEDSDIKTPTMIPCEPFAVAAVDVDHRFVSFAPVVNFVVACFVVDSFGCKDTDNCPFFSVVAAAVVVVEDFAFDCKPCCNNLHWDFAVISAATFPTQQWWAWLCCFEMTKLICPAEKVLICY